MRRFMAWLLATLLIGSTIPALGERTHEQLDEELIVGSSVAMSGNFFDESWGANTADIDARRLIHSCSPAVWSNAENNFVIDKSVVSRMVATQEANGSKTYTMTLAGGLRFSDGTPISAQDYVFSLLLGISSEVRELGGNIAKKSYLLGTAAYLSGKVKFLTGVRLLGKNQFSMTVEGSFLPDFYELSMLQINPYPISIIAPGCEVVDNGAGVFIRNLDLTVKEPIFSVGLLRETILDPKTGYMSHPRVSSGPYTLTSFDRQAKEARFARNPHYKGDAEGHKPEIERLVYRYVPQDEAIRQLADGDIDLMSRCTQALILDEGQDLCKAGEFAAKQYPRNGMGFISFTCEKGPMQFVRVRQALAMCLNRDRFVAEHGKGYEEKVNGYYGPGQWMVPFSKAMPVDPTVPSLENLYPYHVDLAAAEALLEVDGWLRNGSGQPYQRGMDAVRARRYEGELLKLDLTLLVPAESGVGEMLTGFQSNAQQIGVRVTIEEMPYEELLKRYYRQAPRTNDMFFLGVNFTMPFDPTSTYSTAGSKQGAVNTTGLRDDKLMKLAIAMRKTEPGNAAEYCKRWMAFQLYWNEVLPMIPLYSNVYFDFHTARLQNYEISENTTWSEAILRARLSDAAEPNTGESKPKNP